MRRRAIAVAVALIVGAGIGGSAVALAGGTTHRAVYRQTAGPSWMPDRVVIRCDGGTEDSLARLRLVAYSGESIDGGRVVYRCATP